MRRKVVFLIVVIAALVILCWPRSQTEIASAQVPAAAQAPQQTFVKAQRPAQNFPEWLQDWRLGAGELEAGKAAAIERREQLAKLMVENPREAFAQSLSWADWRALPEEIRALVERPFSEVVELSVRPVCRPMDASLPNAHPHRVLLAGEWRDAYMFGRRTEARSKVGLPVRGFELDGKVVLSDEGVERISNEDLAAVEELFPNETNGRSWITGEPAGANGRRVLIGGRIYDLASEEEENRVASLVAKAEASLHPKAMSIALGAGAGTIKFDIASAEASIEVANSTWTETVKRTIALRISYADAPSAYSYATEADLRSLMLSVSNAVKVMSYGKTSLQVTVVSVTLPQNHAYYQANGADAISTDTRARLIAMGLNRSNYDFATHAHPQHNFAYAGLGQIGAGDCWLNGNQGLEVTTHEIGHNYGLGHAHYANINTGTGPFGHTNPDGSHAEREEYGDIYDIMGGSSLPAGQFGAYGKAALNWIEQRDLINVWTNGIYRVHRFDHADARLNANNRLALRIATPGGDEFWVSHRKLFTTNPNLTRGASILRADGGADQSLVDATPLSRASQGYGADKDDAGLPIGRTFTDPLGTVQIKTIAASGVAPQEYIDVQVTYLDEGAFELFTDATGATRGLAASFVNRSLRAVNQTDWRTQQVISGRRTDRFLNFRSNGWGARGPVGVTGGTDADWENYSVQWDGVIVVNRPIRLATVSDDGSRMWIDTNNGGTFGVSELVSNGWGNGQGPTRGPFTPVLKPGAYAIRIQYEEGNGGNVFYLAGYELPFQLFTTEGATTSGLTGSYVRSSLRAVTSHADWRTSQTISGARVDTYPAFTKDGWGTLASAGLLAGGNGSDADWNNFSVQWDGWVSNSVPLRFATASDDGSRVWIDVNGDGVFAAASPEYVNNNWGVGQGMTIGALSQTIQPGNRRIRIQYEEGNGGNGMLFLGAPPVVADPASLLTFTTFTGTDNRVISRRGTNDFTIQFWMRSAQVVGGENEWTDGAGLVDASVDGPARDFGLGLGNGKVLFGVGGSMPVTVRSPFVADNVWHHVSARRERDTGVVALFIDGIPVGSGVGGAEALDENPAMRAGSYVNNTGYFVGQIDQVRIWDAARTDQEILADYHLNRSGHGYVPDAAPEVQITRLAPTSMQVHWDAISGFRMLQSAAQPEGPWTTLGTDQNTTNIVTGATARRYFRVMRP